MLTDSKVRQLKPNGKIQKVFDGGGLYVQVAPTGSLSWRMAYRFGGKQKTYTIGQYPEVSLADARLAREQAKRLLAQGIDPSAKKQEEKAAATNADANTPVGMTFEQATMEWFERKKGEFSDSYAPKLLCRYRKHLFPRIGHIPMDKLRPRDILNAAKEIEAEGHAYTARLIARYAARVCVYGQAWEYCETNVGAGLASVLKKPETTHRAAIVNPDEYGQLLVSLDNYSAGHYAIRYALRLMPYVFLRSFELRGGRWKEVDFDAAMWIIPAERMKMREEHAVPLARQVVDLLRELRKLDGDGEFMFPSSHSRTQIISDMGLLNARGGPVCPPAVRVFP